MPSFRPLPWFLPAFLVVATSNGPARAWKASILFATGPNPLIVKIEGRKGTRLYRPDESEAQEKAAAEKTSGEKKLDECMASWDTKTHIAKSNWRQICEREIKNNE